MMRTKVYPRTDEARYRLAGKTVEIDIAGSLYDGRKGIVASVYTKGVRVRFSEDGPLVAFDFGEFFVVGKPREGEA